MNEIPPLTVAHVLETIGQQAAGPTQSVTALCRGLSARGHQVELHVLQTRGTPLELAPISLHRYPQLPILSKLGLSPQLRRGVREAAARSQVLHVHGLWRMPGIHAASAAQASGCKLVVSPRGMLEAYALGHHVVPKRLFWLAAQQKALASAACLHATSEQEYASMRRAGFRTPVAIVANGVSMPQPASARFNERPANRGRELLFLARLHPIKGIDRLIRAWSQVEARFPEWHLRVVGPDSDGYLATLRGLALQLKLERVRFEDSIFGAEKERAFAEADLYILPSHSENFGITVAEALAAGTPVISSQGTPWQGLETRRCGWWVPNDVASLRTCFEQALATAPDQLASMGARGRQWMLEEFSWAQKAEQMEQVYEWLLERGPAPACVQRT